MRAALLEAVATQHMQVLAAHQKRPLPHFVVHGQRAETPASQVGQRHGAVRAHHVAFDGKDFVTVEVAGVEPACPEVSDKASTCLAAYLV